MINEKTSKTIQIMRAFAVLSIICAHCNTVNPKYNIINLMASDLLSSVGAIGVAIFFFISGYLMSFSKRSYKDFIIRKLKTLILPWIFCGVVVYLYVYLRKGGISAVSLVKWLAGIDTYLYFMSVLLILYFILYTMVLKPKLKMFFLIISLIGYILFTTGIVQNPFGNLNPFAFMVYMVIGIIVGQYEFFEVLSKWSQKNRIWLGIAFCVLLLILAFVGITVDYFDWFYIGFETIAFFVCLGISAKQADRGNKILYGIGEQSFSIYLLHMPIAGIVANIFNRVDFWLLTLVRPIVVLALSYLLCYVISKLLNNCGKLKLLFGMRK